MTNLLLVVIFLCMVCLAYIATQVNKTLKWLISHSKHSSQWTAECIANLERRVEMGQARTEDAVHRAVFEFTTAQGQLEAERRLLRKGPVEYHGSHYTVEGEYTHD